MKTAKDTLSARAITFLNFSAVGLFCTLIDMSVFHIFTHFILKDTDPDRAIMIATLCSKSVSSFTNYLLNKEKIFRSSDRTSIIRYYILILTQTFISANAISFLYGLTKIEPSLLKMFVDLLLFFAGYNVLRLWVFPNKNKQ